MRDFNKLSPAELQLVMAKLFHHAWYDDNRGRFLLEVLQDWEKNPCKEVKFLNEIQNGKEQTELR